MDNYQTRIIPVDNTLNHLDIALNTEKMKGIFQQQMNLTQSAELVDCQIERIKYKPQKNCLVTYRLSIKDFQHKKIEQQLVCSRFYEQQGSTSRYFKEIVKGPSPGSLMHIPELDCVTWIFPNDRKLTHLKNITDGEFLYHHIAPGLVNQYAGPDWSIRNFQVQMIRYVPEQSCCVRAEFDINHKHSKAQQSFVAFGKTSYDTNGTNIFHQMQQIRQSTACLEQRLNIPKPLLYQPELKMLWQTGVPGMMLSELLDDATLFINSVKNVGRQLGLLHQVSLVDCQRRKQQSCYQELTKVEQLLCKFNAPAKNKIIHSITLLVQLLPLDPSMQEVTLHGDLHPKNILIDGDNVYLIDLDNIYNGSPLLDVSSFIAAILNLELMTSISPQLAKQSIKAFLIAYRESVPWTIDDLNLRRHIAKALIVERIFRSFTRLKAGRMENIENLAQQAEMLLDVNFTPDWLPTGECYG